MTLTEKSGHLAWCAMVALALARQNGDVLSPAQENLFLTRWLATALKQRRFSRDVAPDIEWLLKQGRQLGVSAKLASKLNYLWRSCTGELSEQNDLFRLTYALETAKGMSWNYRLLSDREWSGRYAVSLNAGVNGIYLSRTNLDAAFDDDGRQINPLLTRLTGNVGGVVKLFNRCGWQAESAQDASLPHQFMLVARQVSGAHLHKIA
ncbi:DUF2913 family protein [Salmonella enterica]|uniref:DUF2913 family protein n=1 Tax=Salmonella enterica subsp. enterica serovar Rubislaw str. ATCC 10717 TaxID=938143 RepID=A0A6W0P252_SALRU|nr:DUF2913 family protein [Salmonella enterica]EBY1810657.1 DUF2913 family protein [Salmonella enterica subsp. enterica serovar Rubislaw]EDJ9214644.1 hypothetical protein [Salmonella enterica subsp. enterica serovar Bareilly]EHF2631166.1 DUF2913 family protein [Salmonella enterica subsp. enterica serovar Panama]EIS1621605.1 DUF2913 family protein [Salmonella enterica subsp. enterica serovar Sandiego]HAE7714863.1 DUF2913 family protein [Salmonella enterica subsp. enterica]